MTHVELLDDDRLSISRACGVPVQLGGLIAAIAGCVLVVAEVPIPDLPPWAVQAGGGLLAVIGLVVLLCRSGATIDREAGTVATWWGLPFPIHQQVCRLTPRAVRMEHQSEMNDSFVRFDWYPITLVCLGEKVALARPKSITKAWPMAQQIADFLNVEMIYETVDGA